MGRRGIAYGIVPVLSGFLLLAGGIPTLAQGTAGHGPQHPTLVSAKGIVTRISPTSLTLQNNSGSTTANLSAGTRVIRLSSATTTDLSPGVHVAAKLSSNGTTVTALRIDRTTKTRHPNPADGARNGHPFKAGLSSHRTPAWSGTLDRKQTEGQLVSINGDTLVIRSGHGQSRSFTLASGVAITQVTSGNLQDLAAGEMVQVLMTSNSAAVSVTILNA